MQVDLTIEFVHKHVKRMPKTGCWRWLLHRGVIAPGKVRQGPYRQVYELVRRKKLDPETGLTHSCRDKRCVNPDHLTEVIRGGNPGSERDCASWEKNGDYTFKSGDGNPKTRLTVSQVQMVKALLLCGVDATTIAEFHNVNRSTIWSIRHGFTWSHVPTPKKEVAAKMFLLFVRTERIQNTLDQLKELKRGLKSEKRRVK